MPTLKSITIDGQKFETKPEFNRKLVKKGTQFIIVPDTYTGTFWVPDYKVKNYTPANGVTLAFNLKLIPKGRFEDDGIGVNIQLVSSSGTITAEIVAGVFDVNYSIEYGGTHGSPYALSVGDAGFQEGISEATITNVNDWAIVISLPYEHELYITE